MSVQNRIRVAGLRLCGIVLLLSMTVCSKAEDHPNIIIIYADDLGFGDLSCYNSKAPYKTAAAHEKRTGTGNTVCSF
ncbi:MAG: hypothetical protein O3B86_12435 [Planctomycetota bacterium]|nr:hypothetical protein [Planctomycetota bacterium]